MKQRPLLRSRGISSILFPHTACMRVCARICAHSTRIHEHLSATRGMPCRARRRCGGRCAEKPSSPD